MKIGILGSGMIGASTAQLFARAGHDIAISNTRGPASLADLVAEIGPRARAVTVEEAIDFGDVVLVAIPFAAYRTLPAQQLAGKIVIDAMNYYPQRDGTIDLGGLGSSDIVAEHLVGARVVKAFNTMYFRTLLAEGSVDMPLDSRLALFLAGDDQSAKDTVALLIEEIGFAPVDTGTLHSGGVKQQPGSEIYNKPLRGADARAALGGVSG